MRDRPPEHRPDEALDRLLRQLTDPHGKWYPPPPPALPDLERGCADAEADGNRAAPRAPDEWDPA